MIIIIFLSIGQAARKISDRFPETQIDMITIPALLDQCGQNSVVKRKTDSESSSASKNPQKVSSSFGALSGTAAKCEYEGKTDI